MEPMTAHARPRRPVGWIVTTTLLVVGLIGAGIYGVLAYGWANDWQQEATAWEESALEWEAEAEEVAEQLEDTEAELEAREEDLADRDEQIDELEDRLAEVTAGREQARDEVAALADQSLLLSSVGAALADCVDDLFDWMGSQPGAYASQTQVDLYFDRGYRIAETCAAAHADFDVLMGQL